MILKQYILSCDKCGKVIDTYFHYKPSMKQIRKDAGAVRINNGHIRVICKDCANEVEPQKIDYWSKRK